MIGSINFGRSKIATRIAIDVNVVTIAAVKLLFYEQLFDEIYCYKEILFQK